MVLVGARERAAAIEHGLRGSICTHHRDSGRSVSDGLILEHVLSQDDAQ